MLTAIIIMCIAILFAHIVDDFYLQGILAKMKQKSWWAENAPDELYKNDYIAALIMHGISWSIMIHIPIIVCGLIYAKQSFVYFVVASIIINAIVHCVIDNLKANKHRINLIQDQLQHIFQIIVTSVALSSFMYVLRV